MGGRVVAIQVMRMWNDLPEEIRLSELVSSFKSNLKTHFYHIVFSDFVCVWLYFFLLFIFY